MIVPLLILLVFGLPFGLWLFLLLRILFLSLSEGDYDRFFFQDAD